MIHRLRTPIFTAIVFSFVAAGAAINIALAPYAHAADTVMASAKVRIAAAADLRYAMDEITKGFETAHPGIKLDIVYGSSGQFTQQILGGADFDLFLSADSSYPEILREKKKVSGADFQYGSGRLVLWTNKSSGVTLDETQGLKNILQPRVKKIAMANPEHAPYGKAAEAVLKKENLYGKVQNELVIGDNIAQAAQFAESKAAQVGLIAYALAVSPEMKKEGTFILLKSAKPLRQSGVILAASKNRQNAQAVRDYMMGQEGQAILATFGFKKE